MDRLIKKRLFDILTSINHIESYLLSSNSFSDYESNSMLQDAVERNLEIIGEAMSVLLRDNSDFPITNARKIVNARNRIIHGYDDIENAEIWAIVKNHLPILKDEVTKLLEQ